MKRIPLCAPLLALVLASAACQSQPKVSDYPPIRFTDGAPIRLDVARIQLVEAYRPPLAAPNVDHSFPVRPSVAIAQWARDRLRAVGADGRAEVVVVDASVVEVKLKKTVGVRGALTTDQSERYDASFAVEVRIIDAGSRQRARARASAKRSISVPEDITLRGREKVWYDMTIKTMKTIDQALQRQIRESAATHVK